MKNLILLLFALCVGSGIQAQVHFKTTSLDAVRAEAVKENKLVFIDLTASWCGPCKGMERTTFLQKDVGDFMAQHFVCAKYDIDQAIGSALVKEYRITSIPTFLIFNVQGELVGQTSGARSAEDFLRDMKQLLQEIAIQKA
ncbi:MAG: thioredoxin domain-containing protein, partial [Alistipes sp.]